MNQLDIFDEPIAAQSHPAFDGGTFDPELDAERLTGQLERVHAIMSVGKWHTLRELADAVQGSEAGVSARIRDLRKEKFGGHTIERQRAGDPKAGRFEYRMQLPAQKKGVAA